MKSQGIIIDSKSPYASPIVVVRKKCGSIRLCVDYRTLNRRTIPDQYTLPRIEEALEALNGNCWFTVLDLRSPPQHSKEATEESRDHPSLDHHGGTESGLFYKGFCDAYFSRDLTTRGYQQDCAASNPHTVQALADMADCSIVPPPNANSAAGVPAKIIGDTAPPMNSNDYSFAEQKRPLDDGDQPEAKKVAPTNDTFPPQMLQMHQQQRNTSSSRRSCSNDPNVFCYICGEYSPQKLRRNITEFVKKAYLAYFGIKLGDQNKYWAPHMVCKTCVECLRQWKNGKLKSLKFGVPMVWRKPQNHDNDCYFCAVKVKGFNRYKKNKWEYPDLESARRPLPHGADVPIPVFSTLPDIPVSEMEDIQDLECNPGVSSGSEYEGSVSSNQQFSQEEFNDLIRDLSLSKQASELLASRLKEKNCLRPEVKVTVYRTREETFLPYFSEDGDFVY
ncbi:uncharacterized protein [Pyxicephalus adspersus]|uniref:uncharacterized protein n=1 Tax=Pyxicephalus adspersus TaxID=30357 RepID=UPI003B5B7FE5